MPPLPAPTTTRSASSVSAMSVGISGLSRHEACAASPASFAPVPPCACGAQPASAPAAARAPVAVSPARKLRRLMVLSPMMLPPWNKMSSHVPGAAWPHRASLFCAFWPCARGDDDTLAAISRKSVARSRVFLLARRRGGIYPKRGEKKEAPGGKVLAGDTPIWRRVAGMFAPAHASSTKWLMARRLPSVPCVDCPRGESRLRASVRKQGVRSCASKFQGLRRARSRSLRGALSSIPTQTFSL